MIAVNAFKLIFFTELYVAQYKRAILWRELNTNQKKKRGRGMLMSVKSHLETFGGAFLMISRNEDGN